ncbi:MAG TPA: hypothetical protein VGK21_01150 [Candidatus Angelobacter sp.]|jgi:hypothetical protein
MKKLTLVSLLAMIFVQTLFAIPFPTPPVGFTWQEIPELKTALLKPDGWFYKREEQKGTLAYFITKENIDKNGRFQTGLTVNVFHLKKDSAVERGKDIIQQLAATKHVKAFAQDAGPFQKFACLAKDTDSSGTTVMYTYAVANPKTNTLYLLIFESPEPEWDTAWKLGKQIVDMLPLEESI